MARASPPSFRRTRTLGFEAILMLSPLGTIPVIDVGRTGALGLYEAAAGQAKALLRGTMQGHPGLALGGRIGDALSRLWLERRDNPFLDEIASIASAIGHPGVYLLNIIYEWACSTSVGADPAQGNRMIRILDWSFEGLGQHVVIARHDTDHGPYYNVTWPGYAGVLTAMAPGRFSAAINQAPRQTHVGLRWVDEVIVHLGMYHSRGTVPASHLLRRVMEEAPDYKSAIAMLMDGGTELAMPALYALSGTRPEEGCIVEAIGRRRFLHPCAGDPAGILGIANDWLSPGLPGVARENRLNREAHGSAAAGNRARRAFVRGLHANTAIGAAEIAPPVLNPDTVLVATANAAAGTLRVDALARTGRKTLPLPVSTARIAA
jgi:hypothetical protein